MKPKTFFKKLSEKVNELDEETKKELFCVNSLSVFKRISEYCNENKKTIVITDEDEKFSFSKFISHFNLSMYYTRRGWAIFLTNFKGLKFNKRNDDRYRFLKRFNPECEEYINLLKKRNKFFKDVLK